MRISQFPLVLLLSLQVGCSSTVPPQLTEAEREILDAEVRNVVEDITAAMNAHDPDRLFAFYRNSEEFVYMGCTDPLFGFEAFSTRVRPYYRANTEITFEQEILRVQILSPTTAVVTLRGRSSEADALFWTEVLIKGEDGRWLVAHEHESWPGCPEPAELHPTGLSDTLGLEG